MLSHHSPVIIATIFCSLVGVFAFNHGWLVLLVVCKRLWLLGTLAVVTTTLMFAVAATSLGISLSGEMEPVYGLLISIGILLIGVILQLVIHRRLPRWELS